MYDELLEVSKNLGFSLRYIEPFNPKDNLKDKSYVIIEFNRYYILKTLHRLGKRNYPNINKEIKNEKIIFVTYDIVWFHQNFQLLIMLSTKILFNNVVSFKISKYTYISTDLMLGSSNGTYLCFSDNGYITIGDETNVEIINFRLIPSDNSLKRNMITVSFKSKLMIKNVDIIQHQITFILFYVNKNCTLVMEKCNIVGNKIIGLHSLIVTDRDSNMIMLNSNIISNSWYYNGYKLSESYVIKTNGTVNISESLFKDNVCPNITIRIINFNDNRGLIMDSKFVNNDSCISSEAKAKLHVINCHFYKNGRGSFYLPPLLSFTDETYAEIIDCHFENNIAEGCIKAIFYVHVIVHKCKFIKNVINENSDEGSAAITAYNSSFVDIEKVKFKENRAMRGAAIYVSDYALMMARNCNFQKNFAYFEGNSIFSTKRIIMQNNIFNGEEKWTYSDVAFQID